MRRAYLDTCIVIYLATALHYGCDEFWTNDDRLSRAAGGIAVDVLATSAKGVGP